MRKWIYKSTRGKSPAASSSKLAAEIPQQGGGIVRSHTIDGLSTEEPVLMQPVARKKSGPILSVIRTLSGGKSLAADNGSKSITETVLSNDDMHLDLNISYTFTGNTFTGNTFTGGGGDASTSNSPQQKKGVNSRRYGGGTVACAARRMVPEDYEKVIGFVEANNGDRHAPAAGTPRGSSSSSESYMGISMEDEYFRIPTREEFSNKLTQTARCISSYIFETSTAGEPDKTTVLATISLLRYAKPWSGENVLRIIDIQLSKKFAHNQNLTESIIDFCVGLASKSRCSHLVIQTTGESARQLMNNCGGGAT